MTSVFKQFVLKSIEVEPRSTEPDAPDHRRYIATFAMVWGLTGVDIRIAVQTTEGWETARHLACEQVKDLGNWLVRQAESEK